MENNKLTELIIEKGLMIIAILSVIIILLIIGFIVVEGMPAIEQIGFFNFIFGMKWAPKDEVYGVFPMIIGTLEMMAISLVIAVPLSIGCSVFMTEYANNTMNRILKPTIQSLAGIPSVIYGFFGLVVLVPFIRDHFGGTGFSLIAASIILSIMILPTIISVSEDAIYAVPGAMKEASYGLGATKWQTIYKVILPTAAPGIVTAIILGMGRAIGETMAVIMVAGNVAQIPGSIFEPVRVLTSNIALEMGYAIDLHYNALFATGIILLIVIMILIAIADYVAYKSRIEGSGDL
ncbi:MAG: phosphate ABC transporter permease subunit PstC [Methanosphaera sp.]|jgi:phosphate transport system permease protein|uniref:phosphate ABC transporter permease subunit PstC n=1 Tax=Methanosphaera TaxID=2316 RepID=UPI002380971C|nr:phosphate ABC transporter permease subunit PstC [Candidatus Methanosphaera massiliense]MDD6285842.1 phosphate ABC transporter permease subunit PstC [Methanobacteriaceae archaeon]MDE4078302.1 phosphate ABC transporter permease subunit PstC [Candidatus Methanosphaera massiliense]